MKIVLALALMTACGTDDKSEIGTSPLSDSSRKPAPQYVPNGNPKSGSVVPVPEGFKKMLQAEVECINSRCNVRFIGQTHQCVSQELLFYAWQVKSDYLYQVGLKVSTADWKSGELIAYKPDRAYEKTSLETLGYQDQSGVFYVCLDEE